MDNNSSLMKWSTLRGMPVKIPSEGITIGHVEDLYFKPDTNAIYALSVRLRLLGDRSLPVTGIRTVSMDGVMIPSAQMLLERLPPLPTVQGLTSAKLVSESGRDLGMLKEVLIAVDPPVAMRIAGFEMLRRGARNSDLVGADAVGGFNDATIVLTDSAAKRFR